MRVRAGRGGYERVLVVLVNEDVSLYRCVCRKEGGATICNIRTLTNLNPNLNPILTPILTPNLNPNLNSAEAESKLCVERSSPTQRMKRGEEWSVNLTDCAAVRIPGIGDRDRR